MAEPTEPTEPTQVTEPTDRTRYATIALHVSTVLYVVVALLLALIPFAWDPDTTPEYGLRAGVLWGLALFTLALAVFVEVVVSGLKRRRRWALIAATVLFVLYLPSAFLPLGIAGLIGTLSPGTRARFPVPRADSVRRRA